MKNCIGNLPAFPSLILVPALAVASQTENAVSQHVLLFLPLLTDGLTAVLLVLLYFSFLSITEKATVMI